MYASDDLFGERIKEEVVEVEVADQSPSISRSITTLDQILEANGEDEDQIDEEASFEGKISSGETDGITFKIS